MSDDERSLDERASELLDSSTADAPPEVVARADTFATVRAALRDIAPPDDAEIDAAVTRAMSATAPTPRRNTGVARTRLLAAAAAVAVIAGGTFALGQGFTGDDVATDSSGEAATALDESFADLDAANDGVGGDSAELSPETNRDDADLGEFDSFADLAESLTGATASDAADSPETQAASTDDAAAESSAGDDTQGAMEDSVPEAATTPGSARFCGSIDAGLTSIGTAVVDGLITEVFYDDALTIYVVVANECEPRLLSEMTEGPSSP